MQLFSIILGLGTLAGLLLVGWRAPQKEAIRYLDAGLGVLFGALLGGRAATVFSNLSYYQSHPGEILQVWLGGLSGVGALAGGLLALFFFARWLKVSAGVLSDIFLPLAGILAASAWLGCWMDSCSYGSPATAWWAMPARDVWGVLTRRVPVQPIGAAASLIVTWLLDRAGRRSTLPGLPGFASLFGISTIIFSLSFLRIDPIPVLNGLRLEAWGAAALMGFSLLSVVVLLLHKVIKK